MYGKNSIAETTIQNFSSAKYLSRLYNITLRLDFILGFKPNIEKIYNLHVLLTASQVKDPITFIPLETLIRI